MQANAQQRAKNTGLSWGGAGEDGGRRKRKEEGGRLKEDGEEVGGRRDGSRAQAARFSRAS